MMQCVSVPSNDMKGMSRMKKGTQSVAEMPQATATTTRGYCPMFHWRYVSGCTMAK